MMPPHDTAIAAIPAKAGTHGAAVECADGWTPACAGDANFLPAKILS
jgi:hypothetical protein